MAVSALPSNALYDVQKYLRQKRATGAQVTPQNERAAWGGYFDTMEANSLNERRFSLLSKSENERLKLAKEAQENAEGANAISGVGQLVSTVGQGAMLLKGTDLGAKVGLGPTTAATPTTTPSAATPGAGGTAATGTATGAAPTTTGAVSGTAPTGAAYSTGAAELAGTEAAASAVGAETGMLSAATPYLGPFGAGFAAGSMIPGLLGFNKGKGELAAGAVSGGVAGGIAGGFMLGAAGTSWSGPGAIVGGIIGAVAGGVGSKVK